MVRGGTDFRKQAGISRKKRTGPVNKWKKQKVDTQPYVIDMVVESSSGEVDEVPGLSEQNETVSESKIHVVSDTPDDNTNPYYPEYKYPTGYRFFDMDIMSNIVAIVACPHCCCLSLTLLEIKKQGLAFQLKLICTGDNCTWSYICWTSKKKSRNFDVNRRIFYSMRRIGNGYQGLKKFLMLMNHPPPMTEKNYRKTSSVFNKSVKHVAKMVMHEAAEEIHSSNSFENDIVDTAVSVDGTWQKRGFTSYNGAVAAISITTGRILDVEAMSRYCQGCVNIEKHKHNEHLYERLKKDHECMKNHEGSAPKMEVSGVQRIFSRSIETNKLRYTEYYGDGDSKSFKEVENVYPGIVVVKKECIGHVQKRVGTGLRKLKKTEKHLGKLGLVDHVIDRLQNYFGMAVRSNVGDIVKMKKAIYAAWCHVCSSEKRNYHVHCPAGADSWCTYQLDIANKTNLYVHGKGLPDEVIKHVKPIFDSLSNDQLLSKCLHGKTQNQNESFNTLIWKRTPKDRFVKLKQFEIAVYDAAAHFNIGNLATLLVYDYVNIERGYFTTNGCINDNQYRIKNARRQSTGSSKVHRRYLRGMKKSKSDKTKKAEGKVYGAGKF